MCTAPVSPSPAAVSTDWLLRPGGRPLFVFAHQDDETVLAGVMRRIVGDGARGRFVWWTNGDGLAPAAGIAPDQYARMRIAEATEALRRIGASAERKTDLATSEIENYRRLTHVARGGAERADAMEYFLAEAERIEAEVRAADPDRVFVLAWQGGHPEHDLTHAMVARAVRRLRCESGRPIPIVGCPAYEFVIACALRFKPWYRGDRRAIVLDPGELQAKRRVIEAYPSQAVLIASFQRVIGAVGRVAALAGRPVTEDDYLAREHFGVVDPELDYERSTHWPELFNYMFDDYLGIPIRFSTMVRPVVRMLLGDGRPGS
jgi:LmbE family N-acetylglucosaminyl deacetylase